MSRKPNTIIFHLLLLAIVLQGLGLQAQTLNLDSCKTKALRHIPVLKQKQVLSEIEKATIRAINMAYIPQLSVKAQGTYQSDVMELPFDVPIFEIPSIPKWQYQATLEASQIIWDGGMIESSKELVRSKQRIAEQELVIQEKKIAEDIEQIYFALQSIDAQILVLGNFEHELLLNLQRVESYMDSGLANEGDLNSVKIEQHKLNQNRIELESKRKALIKALGIFIGEDLPNNVSLDEAPKLISTEGEQVMRPELKKFRLRGLSLQAELSKLNANLWPRLIGFAQGGYGRPGLNFLKPEAAPFFIAGIKMLWPIGQLYSYKHDKSRLKAELQSIELEQESYLIQQQSKIAQKKEELNAIRSLMQEDDAIIALRKSNKAKADKQFELGVISMSDLMEKLYELHLAMQNKAIHLVQEQHSLYQLSNLLR